MILSTLNLKNAIEKFKADQKTKTTAPPQNGKKNGEKNGDSKGNKPKITPDDGANAGVSAAFMSFGLIVAIIFFILEVILLFYALKIAIVCTKPGGERTVHVVLAIVFTFPYILLNALFNNCAKNALQT